MIHTAVRYAISWTTKTDFKLQWWRQTSNCNDEDSGLQLQTSNRHKVSCRISNRIFLSRFVGEQLKHTTYLNLIRTSCHMCAVIQYKYRFFFTIQWVVLASPIPCFYATISFEYLYFVKWSFSIPRRRCLAARWLLQYFKSLHTTRCKYCFTDLLWLSK